MDRNLDFDYFVNRRPIGCGLPIEPGTGCSNSCLYCYIQDLGLEFQEPKVSPLSGEELMDALLKNDFFGEDTFLAFGNTCEPFCDKLADKTLEWVETLRKYFDNPIQFSTKSHLDSSFCAKIEKVSGGRISPLVTITTIDNYPALEPDAPSPKKRFETIYNLSSVGLDPILFFRPAIPDITTDHRKVLAKARDSGAAGVVVSNFRISEDIFERLNSKFDCTDILDRMEESLEDSEVDVWIEDLREELEREAGDVGLRTFRRTCCANAFCHDVKCFCDS